MENLQLLRPFKSHTASQRFWLCLMVQMEEVDQQPAYHMAERRADPVPVTQQCG